MVIKYWKTHVARCGPETMRRGSKGCWPHDALIPAASFIVNTASVASTGHSKQHSHHMQLRPKLDMDVVRMQ